MGIICACAGSCFAGLCCGACRNCSGNKTGVISRIPYIFLFFIAGVFALVMSLYGEESLDLKFYSIQVCDSDTCAGNGSVYRVSFCLFIFELIHVIVIGAGAVSFHWLWFAIKFMIFAAALTITFFMDDSNDFFNGFADYFSRYLSAIYLLVQILILISWGYETNEYLQEKSNSSTDEQSSDDRDEDEKSSSCNVYTLTLLVGSIGSYIASFTCLGLFFVWYANDSACSLHETIIVISIVLCIITALLSIVIGNGSFFVSGVVSFYCTFLVFSAMQADTNDDCNEFADNRDTASLWIGYILTFLALFYAALRANSIGILFTDAPEIEQPLLSSEEKRMNSEDGLGLAIDDGSRDIEKNDDGDGEDGDDDEKESKSEVEDEVQLSANEKMQARKQNVYFHSIMTLASCYMAMLFTNWGTNNDTLTKSGKISLWVNLVCQWATFLLFWQTLIAPVLCPSRFPGRVRSVSG